MCVFFYSKIEKKKKEKKKKEIEIIMKLYVDEVDDRSVGRSCNLIIYL